MIDTISSMISMDWMADVGVDCWNGLLFDASPSEHDGYHGCQAHQCHHGPEEVGIIIQIPADDGPDEHANTVGQVEQCIALAERRLITCVGEVFGDFSEWRCDGKSHTDAKYNHRCNLFHQCGRQREASQCHTHQCK